MYPKSVSGCILLLHNTAEGMFTNQVVEVDFAVKVSCRIQLYLGCMYRQYNVSTLTMYCTSFVLQFTVANLVFFKETCCMFWPNEITKSMEFAHIKVNHDSTISKTGYEVTRLDVFEKGIVSLH